MTDDKDLLDLRHHAGARIVKPMAFPFASGSAPEPVARLRSNRCSCMLACDDAAGYCAGI
jgi:hypothetical protein